MAKINFHNIPTSEKRDIFNAIATDKGMTPFAVEKDWWVSRVLVIIFKMPIWRDWISSLRWAAINQ